MVGTMWIANISTPDGKMSPEIAEFAASALEDGHMQEIDRILSGEQ